MPLPPGSLPYPGICPRSFAFKKSNELLPRRFLLVSFETYLTVALVPAGGTHSMPFSLIHPFSFLSQEEAAAKIAEEVHREIFLEKKAGGSSNPTDCPGYLKKTSARMIEMQPEGSEARIRLQAYFSNDQAIRNLVNNKLGIKVAGGQGGAIICNCRRSIIGPLLIYVPFSRTSAVFKHVIEYEEEKAAAAAAAAAAQLAADRLGDFNVPLLEATDEEVAVWMERFLADHVEINSIGLAVFKAPTLELKNASRTIITRSQVWGKRHNALQEKIASFCKNLSTANALAFSI